MSAIEIDLTKDAGSNDIKIAHKNRNDLRIK